MTVATGFLSLILAVIIFSYFFYLSKLKNYYRKISTYKGKHLIKKEPSTPAPFAKLSLLKALFWSTFFGEWKLTNFYVYVGQLGHIVELQLYGIKYLFLNDFKTAKEGFKNPIVCARPTLSIYEFYTQGANGILFNSGQEWKEHRKFCNHHLKTFGLGTKTNEKFIQIEVEELCERWLRKEGKTFSPNKDFYVPVVNSLWLILAGEIPSAETSKRILNLFEGYKSCLTQFNLVVAGTNVKLETISRIHDWIPIFWAYKSMYKSILGLRSYFQEILGSRKGTFIQSQCATDLVDAYLNAISKHSDKESMFSSKISEKHLLTIMFDILFAGGDTTGNALSWCMLHLVRNPDVQETIWNEIDTVVGRDRNPCLNDKPNCPYTEAFIHEVLRFSPVLPVGVAHATADETTIGSHLVQKDTIVFCNTYGIHHDPTIWGDPENFRPERFLSADGKTFIKNEAMCIFSMGPRRCIGEQVARDSLFLYISTICKRFQLKKDPMLKDRPGIYDENSIIHVPQYFNIVAVDRSIENLKPNIY